MKRFIIAVCLLGCWACDDLDDRPIDSKRIAQAIKDRKPQHISPKDLELWVQKKGTAWCFAAQKDLYRQVKRAMAAKTLASVQDFDTLETLPAVDSIIQQYQISMQGYSFKKTASLPNEARTLLENYTKNTSNREASVLSVPTKDVIYFATPILLDNELVGAWLITLPQKVARRWFDRKDLRQ